MEILLKKIQGDISIYAQNINTLEIYSLNAPKIMPSASVIKLPILYLLYQKIYNGEINITDKLNFSEKDLVDDSPYFAENNFKSGYLDLYNTAHSMITVSDNTSTNLLIDFLGMENINSCIQELGMKNTFLKRKMCDFEKRSQGIDNLTTAFDMTKFFSYISNLLSKEPFNEMFKIITEQKDLEKIPSGFQNSDLIIANKPGELPGIRNDTALIILDNSKIAISILTENVQNEEETDIVIGQISRKFFDLLL